MTMDEQESVYNDRTINCGGFDYDFVCSRTWGVQYFYNSVL